MNPDGNGEDEEDGPSFADLVGETKPLTGGRVHAPTHRPKPTRTAAGLGSSSHDRIASSTFRWPSPHEPRLAAASGVSDAQLRSLERGEPEPEERIDLHGLRSDSAPERLARRLEATRARGLRSVLVIHGQGRRSATGEAVLRDGLPDWLTSPRCARHVLAFAPAPARLGGAGATLVLLRRRG